MRHVALASLALAAGLAGLAGGRASAAPFDPALVPDQVEAAGHLDVDALRRTQIFTAFGGDLAIDAALEDAPPNIRSQVRSLSRLVRGITFWKEGERGAVVIQTGDTRGVAQLIAKLPTRPIAAIDGFPSYAFDHDAKQSYCTAFGGTLVFAETTDSLERAVHVLGGRAPSLAASRRLPTSTRPGVFVLVTIGDSALNAIQKHAQSKVLQLGLRTLVLDVGEAAGQVTATARAEMKSTEAVDKAKSIVEGLRALASLSDEPQARQLIDAVTVTSSGQTLEVAGKLAVADLAKLIQASHDGHGKGHHGHGDK
jgi:hypothetical protein